MADILGITFPIYAAIAIGYLVVKIGWFAQRDMKVLGDVVLNIAMPAMLFYAIASRDVTEAISLDYILVFLIGGLATILCSYIWFSLTAPDKGRRAIAVLGSSCPNSGFIGYPVLLLAFPDIAGIVLGMNFLVENIVLIPICLILMDLTKGSQELPVLHRIAQIFWGVLKRPLVVGLLAGLAVSIAGIPLPGPAERLFVLLANSAAALSLLVIGGSLVGLPMNGNKLMATQIALAKLVMHPVLTGLTIAALGTLGFVSLGPELFAAAILSSAMPMFGIYTVLSQELGLERMASIAMLVTTSAAFFTINAILFWLT